MSYILEALKKAEAERQQGAVPSLHAPATTLPTDIGMPAKRRQIIVGAGILLAISLGLLAWLRPWQSAPASLPAPLPLAAEPSPTTPTSPTLTPTPTRTALPETAIVAVAPAPTEVVPQPTAKPRAAAQERPPKASRQAEAGQSALAASAAPAAPVVAAAAATPPAAAAPIASRELPGVSIGGYIYSETPAERQLLVNKRLMHEGEEVTPGLTLEKMLPKAAIFNYRGQRYQVAY